MVECNRNEEDSRISELVEIVKDACRQRDIKPIYIWPCGSRLFNLQTCYSDYDFLVVPKSDGISVQLYEPCKIDIFVHTLENIKWHIENYDKTSFLRCLFLLVNVLVHDELKIFIDYKRYCMEFLEKCLTNKKVQVFEGNYKAIYYKYILYYYVMHDFTFEFTDDEWQIIQRAHDKNLTIEKGNSLNQQIIDLLQEQRYIEF